MSQLGLASFQVLHSYTQLAAVLLGGAALDPVTHYGCLTHFFSTLHAKQPLKSLFSGPNRVDQFLILLGYNCFKYNLFQQN